METHARGRGHIEQEFLHRLLHLRIAQPVIADERRDQGVEVGKRHRARHFAGQGVDEIHRLAQHRAQVLGRLRFELARRAAEPAFEEIVQVPAGAIRRQSVQIVQMEIAGFVGFADFFGIDFVQPVFFDDVGNRVMVQPLQRERHIGVFLHLPVEFFQVLVHPFHRFIRRHRRLADAPSLLAVQDVGLGGFHQTFEYQNFLHDILDLFDGRDLAVLETAVEKFEHPFGHLRGLDPVALVGGGDRLEYRSADALGVKIDYPSVPFLNFCEFCHHNFQLLPFLRDGLIFS